ncbi:MAG: aquaporin [Burkholderiales bacterium]
MLLCAVIGSGIMADALSGGNTGLALLANTLVTVFALYVLIEVFGPVSGAHLNPLITLVFTFFEPTNQQSRAQRVRIAAVFIAMQLAGAVAGAWLAHLMFDLPVLQASAKLRASPGLWVAEAVATGGLIFVILRSCAVGVHAKASVLVACYIGAAYWFTASTSFANPAAVLGRMLSDSFAGIAPASALAFVAAQCVGALLGVALNRAFKPT